VANPPGPIYSGLVPYFCIAPDLKYIYCARKFRQINSVPIDIHAGEDKLRRMRPCLSVGRPSSCVGVRSLCLEIASTAGMIVHAYVQLSTSAAHGSMWAGVQLSKLSAEVHEYEGGLEGARPCVGPQAYVW